MRVRVQGYQHLVEFAHDLIEIVKGIISGNGHGKISPFF